MAQPTTRREKTSVEDHVAVELALAGGVLGDVGDPELVWAVAPEVPFDQVVRVFAEGTFRSAPQWESGQPSAAHQRGDGLARHDHALAQDEFGADPR